MKLNVFDFFALGVAALGSILLGVSNMRHASQSAIDTVEAAFDEAKKSDVIDATDYTES